MIQCSSLRPDWKRELLPDLIIIPANGFLVVELNCSILSGLSNRSILLWSEAYVVTLFFLLPLNEVLRWVSRILKGIFSIS